AVQAAQQQAGQQAAQQQAQQAAAAAAAAQQAAQQQAAQQAAAAIAAAKEAAAKAAAAAEAAKVPVPKVTGMWLTPGKNLLIGQGFKVKALGKSAGIIRKQDPAPDARVEKGSTVTITVGK
ncbi:MAG TPA: PASTA domain-containing protein, partial [Elusimicrobiales bacterium]|nr:PASTA domain-containing protein [Elusimicrobiales bacterium]